MTDRDNKELQSSRIPVILLVLLLVPTLYFASFGPLFGLGERGALPKPAYETICQTLYYPVIYVDEETDIWETTLGGLYLNYVLLFAPSSPP